jgi:hypothetical protein
MPWADIAYTEAVTRRTVTEADLVAAQAIIDLFSRRDESAAETIGTRDRGYLRQAVAWQAAWMLDQPGLSSRSSVEGVDQDGNRTTFVDAEAVVLAPLARKALGNLSWKRSRTVDVKPFTQEREGVHLLEPGQPYPEAWDDNEAANEGTWVPL